jgi:hypothetical protein
MPTGTRGAAKKKAPVKLKTKKSNSSESQEVLPVDDSSQGSGSVLQFSSGEDTSNGSGSGSAQDTSDEEPKPKRKQVSAEQAVRKDDDAPTSKQLTLALAIKAHYDTTHKHGVKIDKKSKESISDWISQMMEKGYQPPWDDSKKKSKKSKKH